MNESTTDHEKNGDPLEGMKWCAHCVAYRPLSEFHRNITKPDGLATYCKEGMKAAVMESKHKKENTLPYSIDNPES